MLNIFSKIKNKVNAVISKKLLPFIKPKMVWYKKDFSGSKRQNLRIGNTTFIDSPEKLELADNIYIGHHNFIEASHYIKIGTGSQITSFISITSHSSHNSIRYYGSQYPYQKSPLGYITGSVEIGEYCFIGPHSLILPGTKIGKGSIVSAYSKLKGEYPEFSIIEGNPARVVGSVKERDNAFLETHPELQKTYMQ